MHPDIESFFDEQTNTASYVVSDSDTSRAVIIDPVLDFDPNSWRTTSGSAEKIANYIARAGLNVDWILESHIHADHLTASAWLKNKIGGRTGVGAGVTEVQRTFAELFNITGDQAADESPFDELFEDGAVFSVGEIDGYVLTTPGHTPACVTYVIGDACFVGDSLLMPDTGTARCDFPGGNAKQMYHSLQRILELPDKMRLFVCHDYGADGTRDFAWETTVAQQRDNNIHVGGGTLEHDYVQMREDRDATLPLPRLIVPAVQVNMLAGSLPPPEENGTSYLKVPLNLL
ncbi:MAG: MBL fold metallo-hydrolase [Pseudomonadota bacterium]|nr:MBL fold metallo-hydrolase [Pseudomonadota bacterium]